MSAARWRRWMLLPAFLLVVAGGHAASPPAPVSLTSEQDHLRMLQLLQIDQLRRGPDGDPASAHAANFDESKVAPYALPDPLLLKDGERVRTGKDWWQRRRPQIVEDFDREVYGRVPRNAPRVEWTVTSATRQIEGSVSVITKSIVGHLDNATYPLIDVNIQLTLTTPAAAAGPVPVIMEFALSPEVLTTLKARFTSAQWADFIGNAPSWQSQLLARGWGYATLIATSVQADQGAGLTQGVIGLANKGPAPQAR